jgi:cullin-associated NEDD8-dissociated protein 1
MQPALFLSYGSILNLRKVVRRVALSSLNSAACTKPHLIRDHLAGLLPSLYKGAVVTKNTVKQDLERAAELQRSALRVIAALSKIGGGTSQKFDMFVDDIRRNTAWGNEFKELVGH